MKITITPAGFRRKVLEEAVEMLMVSPTGTCSKWGLIKEFLLSDDLKECRVCKSIKISSPTPEGDEVCVSCGDREMMDYEPITLPA